MTIGPKHRSRYQGLKNTAFLAIYDDYDLSPDVLRFIDRRLSQIKFHARFVAASGAPDRAMQIRSTLRDKVKARKVLDTARDMANVGTRPGSSSRPITKEDVAVAIRQHCFPLCK